MQGLIKRRESFLAAVQAGQCGTMSPGAPSTAALCRRTTQWEAPKYPKTLSGPTSRGEKLGGFLRHLLLGFLLRLLLQRVWGVGRCLCLEGTAPPLSTSFARHCNPRG